MGRRRALLFGLITLAAAAAAARCDAVPERRSTQSRRALRQQLPGTQPAARRLLQVQGGFHVPAAFQEMLSKTAERAAVVQPEVLADKYPGMPPNSSTQHVQLHWVITSCDRHLWGRMMTRTLISGLFNELHPATVSVVWCRAYAPEEYPPLLHDLRHSHSINVFFPSRKLMAQVSRETTHNLTEGVMLNHTQLRPSDPTYLTALMVPSLLQRPDLPLLITEDDVVFAPDANARLATVLGQLAPVVQSDPFLIQVYECDNKFGPAPDDMSDVTQAGNDRTTSRVSHDYTRLRVHERITWGAQGFFYSPAMTALILSYWLAMSQRGVFHPNYGQDTHVTTLVRDEWHCNKEGSECHYYVMYPSLIQHIGTSSSIFNGGNGVNQRYHWATNFPVKVSLPGLEEDGMWRRQRRRAQRRALLQGRKESGSGSWVGRRTLRWL